WTPARDWSARSNTRSTRRTTSTYPTQTPASPATPRTSPSTPAAPNRSPASRRASRIRSLPFRGEGLDEGGRQLVVRLHLDHLLQLADGRVLLAEDEVLVREQEVPVPGLRVGLHELLQGAQLLRVSQLGREKDLHGL